MALRSLDNALPIASERPKKQAKVAEAAPIKKQLADAVAVNDENQAPLPPPSGDSTINYISSENLAALTDPETEIQVICCFEPKARICFRILLSGCSYVVFLVGIIPNVIIVVNGLPYLWMF